MPPAARQIRVPDRGAAGFPTPAPPTVYDDESVDLQTPELVELQLPLAGPASRLLALLWDLLHLLLAEIALILLFVFLGESLAPGVGVAIFVLAQFALIWGYRFFWEWRHDGQTPGKRKLGLRTVREDGRGLTVREAAVRQLLLVIDLQPAFTGAVGLLLVMFTARRQRLGDVVAGTLVVRDLPSEFPLPAAPRSEERRRTNAGPPRLPDRLFEALDRYHSADALDEGARSKLAQLLVERCSAYTDSRDECRGPADLRRLHDDELARRLARDVRRGEGSALAARLLRERREAWVTFRDTCTRLRREGGLTKLNGDQVRAFAAEHRAVAADLARARTYGSGDRVIWALQRTLASAHVLLHRSWGSLPQDHPLLHGFPRLVRRHARPLLIAAAVFFGSALVTFVWLRLDPALEREIVPQVLITRADEAAQRWAEDRGYVDIPLGRGPLASASLVTNNVQVAFLAFAGGLVAGLGTLAVLVLNGMLLGGVFAVFAERGVTVVLTDFVMPHGVVELTALVFAGGAGLHMGAALVNPGRRERWTLVRERAHEVIGLVLGVIVMLGFAALTEAFISPRTDWSVSAKAIYSASTAVLLVAWFAWGGRAPLRADDDA